MADQLAIDLEKMRKKGKPDIKDYYVSESGHIIMIVKWENCKGYEHVPTFLLNEIYPEEVIFAFQEERFTDSEEDAKYEPLPAGPVTIIDDREDEGMFWMICPEESEPRLIPMHLANKKYQKDVIQYYENLLRRLIAKLSCKQF